MTKNGCFSYVTKSFFYLLLRLCFYLLPIDSIRWCIPWPIGRERLMAMYQDLFQPFAFSSPNPNPNSNPIELPVKASQGDEGEVPSPTSVNNFQIICVLACLYHNMRVCSLVRRSVIFKIKSLFTTTGPRMIFFSFAQHLRKRIVRLNQI